MAAYSAWMYLGAGITWDSVALSEQHIYGSSRVGYAQAALMLYPTVPTNPHALDSCHYLTFEGWKRYEISNHLGNVLAVISDRKHGKAVSGTDIQWFEADILSAQQYYPFGMLMPGDTSPEVRRQYALGGYDYRFGFNGKEGDDEVKGDDNQQDYGMRIYDPRVSRFLSVDPIAREYPMLTPYQFASNRPIDGIDLDGLEYYYSADGRFLGQGVDRENQNVYLGVPLIGRYGEIPAIMPSDLNGNITDKFMLVNNNHTDFQKFAGIAYREEHSSKEGTFSVASSIMNFIEGYNSYNKDNPIYLSDIVNDKLPNYSYASKNPLEATDEEGVKNAFAGAINALVGGKDYSNGATHWDGFDFAAKGLNHIKAKQQGIDISQDHIDGLKNYWTDSKIKAFSGGKYKEFADNFIAGEIAVPSGLNKGRVLYKSSAQWGGTVFWKPNTENKANEGYNFMYYYQTYRKK